MISSSRKTRRTSDSAQIGRFVTWLWISCIFVAMVSGQTRFYRDRYGKRKEIKALSGFQAGSRFGRSEAKSAKESSKLFEVAPRIDRFFYSSRYGKRSSPAAAAAALARARLALGPFLDLERGLARAALYRLARARRAPRSRRRELDGGGGGAADDGTKVSTAPALTGLDTRRFLYAARGRREI